MSTRIAIVLLTMLGCVGCDQATKAIARARLPLGQTISLLGDTLRLERTTNPGGFLSLGEALPRGARVTAFTAGGALLVLVALLWAFRSRRVTPLQVFGAALICGGGLGNVIDRVMYAGHVTDFLNLGIGARRTGIFNVADMALMAGLALVVLGAGERHPRSQRNG
ncbi:MAG: signal peptidase II [Steroidobacteraceae bacterium]